MSFINSGHIKQMMKLVRNSSYEELLKVRALLDYRASETYIPYIYEPKDHPGWN